MNKANSTAIPSVWVKAYGWPFFTASMTIVLPRLLPAMWNSCSHASMNINNDKINDNYSVSRKPITALKLHSHSTSNCILKHSGNDDSHKIHIFIVRGIFHWSNFRSCIRFISTHRIVIVKSYLQILKFLTFWRAWQASDWIKCTECFKSVSFFKMLFLDLQEDFGVENLIIRQTKEIFDQIFKDYKPLILTNRKSFQFWRIIWKL